MTELETKESTYDIALDIVIKENSFTFPHLRHVDIFHFLLKLS
jgi:hypothetical protein